MATPYVTVVRNAVTSTQDLATETLVNSGGPVLVVAAEQTEGRGRGGNQWWQATCGVAASLAIPQGLLEIDQTFSLVVGLAVRSAIADVAGVLVDLKWPNDLMLDGRKVGGILVERDSERTVVGCGLNLYWPDAPTDTGGLFEDSPSEDIGRLISERWAADVLSGDMGWDRDAYIAACTTIGNAVTWQPTGRGKALTVDDEGGLVVATREGKMVLRSGAVSAVRTIP